MKTEDFKFRSSDGLECYGYLARAGGSDAPCLIELPAGVRGSFVGGSGKQDNFYANLDGFLNSNGFSIFHIDRRGAVGHGSDFENKGDYAGKEVDDIICGINYLRNLGLVKNDAMGIYGVCSSCVPAVWTLSKVGYLKFGILVSGVHDISLQGRHEVKIGSRLKPIYRIMGVSNLDDFPHKERSPTDEDIRRIDVPLFFYHGRNDFVTPVEHSRSMVARLRELGKDIEYHEIEDFSHMRSSSDPTTPLGRELWEKFFNFLNGKVLK